MYDVSELGSVTIFRCFDEEVDYMATHWDPYEAVISEIKD
jgi:hypothetical protein